MSKQYCSIEEVRIICEMLKDPKLTYTEIANKMNVSRHVISRIAHGKTWTYVSIHYRPFPKRDTNEKKGQPGKRHPGQRYGDKIELIMNQLDDKFLGKSKKSLLSISKEIGVPYDLVCRIWRCEAWKVDGKKHIFYNERIKEKEDY